MNNEITQDLCSVIDKLKLEILDKQEQLQLLINKYQELSGIEPEDEDNINEE